MKWNDEIVLRRWQADALDIYRMKHEAGQKDFVCVVTPAGGKTIYSLAVANYLFESGEIDQVIVVVHTDNLRSQWAEAASYAGLKLCPDIDSRNMPIMHTKRSSSFTDDLYQGAIITYQQLASRQDDIARAVRRKTCPTLVIIDEAHHCADSKTWGNAVKSAFRQVHRRLLLSGTMFRNDSNKIPFIRYLNGIGQEDYNYTYSDALSDGVVSPVYFPTYGGDTKWRLGDREFEYHFGSQMSQAKAQLQLNAAITNPEWVKVLLVDFYDRLVELQEDGHRKAKGLIVARNQDHARMILKMINRISGKKQDIAISDEPDSHETIRQFNQQSRADVIVSVGMITEGVDFPDLRVGAFLSNVTTELTFRQVVGRLTRLHSNRDTSQSVYLYMPRHPSLLMYANDIADKRQHVIEDKQARSDARAASRAGESIEYILAMAQQGATLMPGGEFTEEELIAAETVRQMSGMTHFTVEDVAKLIRAQKQMLSGT